MKILTSEALRAALENLSYRERRVLELRYGLGDQPPRTLEEIGRTFSVTRERIRQIENQSLRSSKRSAKPSSCETARLLPTLRCNTLGIEPRGPSG